MENNFKKLSELKKKTLEALDDSKYVYDEEKELKYLKERMETLSFNLDYHKEKVIQTKSELTFIINQINSSLAKTIEIVNEPIDIPVSTAFIKTPTYPND